MSRVRSKDTKIEIAVRKLAHRLGYRFRTNVAKLPGKPDVVFPRFNTALFVHGCFWHGHSCEKGRLPKTNASFWAEKIETTKIRDRRNARELEDLGWRVFELWECQLKDEAQTIDFLKTILRR
nr:very short patch repair endonuclease [Agrobacterium larrymoorei]